MRLPSVTAPRATAHARKSAAGFTLVELLVVIAVISILVSLSLPALGKAKTKGQTALCSSNMKNWAYATAMYEADNNEYLPSFGDDSTDPAKPFWHGKLAPYLLRKEESKKIFTETQIFGDAIRRCPGGRAGPPPFYTKTFRDWNCWIGANFGGFSEPMSAPFYYADRIPPLKLSRITRPDDALAYMDTVSHFVYTPAAPGYSFVLDLDFNGIVDSMGAYDYSPYNFARPTVHNNGANVTLLDGHVERVPFQKLWELNEKKQVAHSYWRLND